MRPQGAELFLHGGCHYPIAPRVNTIQIRL